MASAFSHAIAALSIGACFPSGAPKRFWIAGALCSVLPDLDVIGFGFGLQYGDPLGHRGLTHSLAFAAALAALVTFTVFRAGLPGINKRILFGYLFLATASHGLLDAMTDGGLGVAFFAPFSNTRYFLPWTPIHVSPIGLSRFFTDRGLDVLKSEVIWIWIPAGLLALIGRGLGEAQPSSSR
jgi:inner membrane protein